MTNDNIKTRKDGSIDVAYYMNRGRVQRSLMAHQLAADVASAPAKISERTTLGILGRVRRVLAEFRFARRSV